MEPRTINVKGANNVEYPVMIGPGLLEQALPEFIKERGYKDIAIITNDKVGPLYGETLAGRLPGSYLITVPDGERHKNLNTIRDMYDALLRHGADRSTLVVTLGGGVVGDMGGFAAATFMRGVPFVQVPTTLLAMVDASVGGKVGVDLPQGKNLVGAFYDPIAVFADVATLKTLMDTEMRGGMAEVIKSALIADPTLLDIIAPDDPKTMAYHDIGRLTEIIVRTVQVKVNIVEQDRLESGVRAYLNLGHTFAHALELASEFRITHGPAVIVGLAAAAWLSEKLGLCDHQLVETVETTLQSVLDPLAPDIGYPLPESGPDDIWLAMQHDKKWRAGKSLFVLLKAAGEPVLVENVDKELVMEVIKRIGENYLTKPEW